MLIYKILCYHITVNADGESQIVPETIVEGDLMRIANFLCNGSNIDFDDTKLVIASFEINSDRGLEMNCETNLSDWINCQ